MISRLSALGREKKTPPAVELALVVNVAPEVTGADAAPMAFKIMVFKSLKDPLEKPSFIEGDATTVLNELATRKTFRVYPGEDVSTAKKRVPLFSLGRLREDVEPGVNRAAGVAHSGVQMVALDVDNASPEQFAAFDAELNKRPWLYLKYPTAQWSPDALRYRYVFPLSRIAPGGAYYTEKLWATLNALSGGIGDKNAKDGARRSFWHSCPEGEEGSRPDAEISGTCVVDPDELAALVPEVAAPAPAREQNDADRYNADIADPERAERTDRDPDAIAKVCSFMADLLKTGNPGGGDGDALWRLGAGVLKYCRNGEELFHDASAKDPRYDRKETQRKRDGWKGDGPPKCKTIAAAGWTGCAACKKPAHVTTPVMLSDIAMDNKSNPDPTATLRAAMDAQNMRMVLDTDGQLNMVTEAEKDGRKVRTVVSANSEAATDALIAATGGNGGKAPTERTIENFKAQQRHSARQRGESVPVHQRVANVEGVIYVDLSPGYIGRITEDGCKIVHDCADGVPLFRRGTGAGALPSPELFPDCRSALVFCLNALIEEFGISRPQALCIVAMVLEWHRTGTPHPILECVGPAGSGKSSLADFVVALVDPSASGGRITVGTAQPDIAAAAQQRYVLTVDNLSKIDKPTSDLFCIVSTGGTLLVRLYYAQSETADLHLHRPLITTSVSPVCTAPDLQERVIRIEMGAKPGKRVSEETLRARWAAQRPPILGALYTLLSGALRELPAIRDSREWTHRQVDYDQMGEAICAAAGLQPGGFLAAVGELRTRMARRTASGDLFLIALLKVLRTEAKKPTHTSQPKLGEILKLNPAMAVWADGDRVHVTARGEALREKLRGVGSAGGFQYDSALPATGRGFLDAVRRVQPLLSSIGVVVEERHYGDRPLIHFDFDIEAIHAD